MPEGLLLKGMFSEEKKQQQQKKKQQRYTSLMPKLINSAHLLNSLTWLIPESLQ